MSAWTKQKIGTLAEVVMGQSPESKYYNEKGDGLPFFQGVTDFGEKYPSVTKWTTSANKVASENDILFSVRAPVGDINVAKYKCALGRGVCAIRSKNNQGEFLYFLLLGNIKKITNIGNGAIYDSINKPTLENIELSVPDLPTQTRIASVLSAYDDLIENNEKRIKALEEMAQLLYTEWFVKFKFPGHEKVKLIDSGTVYGKIPEGWEVKNVESLIKRIPVGKKYENKNVFETGKVPVLDQGKSGFIGFHNDEPGVQASIENPVIVFANHTCYQNIIVYPFSAIQNVLPFIPNDDRSIVWLHWATKDLIKFNDYKGHWPEFMAKKLIVPTTDLTKKFGSLVGEYVAMRYKLQKENQTLSKTRDLLIPQLVTGRRELKNI